MKSSTYMNTVVLAFVTVVTIEGTLFWDREVTPRILVEVCTAFRGMYYLHLYG
jgi:hypothetical protein